MQHIIKPATKLQRGDIVTFYGAWFEIQDNAHCTHTTGLLYADMHGPSETAVCDGICVDKRLDSHFSLGEKFRFQGNASSAYRVDLTK